MPPPPIDYVCVNNEFDDHKYLLLFNAIEEHFIINSKKKIIRKFFLKTHN